MNGIFAHCTGEKKCHRMSSLGYSFSMSAMSARPTQYYLNMSNTLLDMAAFFFSSRRYLSLLSLMPRISTSFFWTPWYHAILFDNLRQNKMKLFQHIELILKVLKNKMHSCTKTIVIKFHVFWDTHVYIHKWQHKTIKCQMSCKTVMMINSKKKQHFCRLMVQHMNFSRDYVTIQQQQQQHK